MRKLRTWLVLFATTLVAVTLWDTCTGGAGLHAQTLADYDYENLTFRGLGFDYGYIWPNKVESASQYNVRLDLGYLGPGLRIAPTITYWSSDLKRPELQRLADRLEQLPALQEQGVELSADDLGNVSWSDLSVGVDAQLVWTVPLNIMTYIGGGVAVHALNGRGTAIEDTFVEDLLDSTTPSFALSAGAEYQLVERLRIYAEGRFTLMSDLRYPGVRAGMAIMLPSRPVVNGSGSGSGGAGAGPGVARGGGQ
jgi:opacity protein-like surface antigen